MNKRLLVVLFFYCIGCLPSYSQSAELPKRSKDLLNKANQAWTNRQWKEAEEHYTKLVEAHPTLLEAHARLANIMELQQRPQQAYQHHLSVTQLRPDAPESAAAYYWLGKYHYQQEQYDSALVYLQKASPLTQPKTVLQKNTLKYVAATTFSIEAIKQPLAIKHEALPSPLNHLKAQYFPVLTGDNEQLFFTGLQQNTGEDILTAVRKDDGWHYPQSISSTINTTNNEGTCTISADGRMLVFTACGRMDSFGSCDLYVSYKKGQQWTAPRNLGPMINTRSWESQPALSADGRTLYFASDRSGGIGKSDIWKSELTADNQWSKPVNLGNKINTPEEENAPFIHANGTTLFFSSTGWPGLGGFDIFRSQIQNGTWSDAVNLGYPINTGADQIGLFITADGSEAYYTEDRLQQKEGKASLYRFPLPESLRATFDATSYIKGTIVDAKTEQPLEARIRLYDLAAKTEIATFSSQPETGEYLAMITQNKSYAVYVERKGYLFKSHQFNTSPQERSILLPIRLEPIEKDRSEILENIYFATGSHQLDEKSQVELAKLVLFLRENPTIQIEIAGHTDDIGQEKDNLELSTKRAQSVVHFLVQSGISAQRLVAKGYGEQQPIVANDSEINRAKNRRIEWQIR